MFKIVIDGKEFKLFTSVSVNLTYDTVASTFSIDSSLTAEALRQGMPPRPLTYKQIEIYIIKPNGVEEILLNGIITGHSGRSEATPGGVRLSGYTKTGILTDVTIPKESYPLQDDNKTLKQITQKILKPFGLSLIVNPVAQEDADRVLPQANASETENAASYIVKLASQNNIIVGHLSRGLLLFTRARANERPSSTYIEGQGEVVSVGYEIDGRAIHSRYTVLRQPEFSDNSSSNPEESASTSIVPIFRPITKTQVSGGADTTKNASVAARMAGLKSAVKYQVVISTLFYQNGEPIRPNRIVKLKAPSAYLENETSFFVVNTALEETAQGSKATLTCILAEALTGRDAVNVF